MKKIKFHVGVFVILVAVIGCAAPQKRAPGRMVEEVAEDKAVEAVLQEGREFENKGDLVAALEQYKIAMTINPSNPVAMEGRDRLETAVRNSAEEHFKTGQKFHKEGKYGRARHEFLIALRLWPDHPEVKKMLFSRKRVQIKRYIVHTIQPGQSLSHVAKIYYGDFHKFPLIAKYNDLIDATRVEVGQKIKVPEIEGVEFLAGKDDIQTEKEEEVLDGVWAWDESGDEEEPVDQAAIYRENGLELFKERKYQEATAEFSKVLSVSPDDKVALEYSYKSNFQIAMALFKKRDYMGARDKFETSLRYNTDCRKCHGFIKKSESLYKEMHYKKGMLYFDKEELEKAIKEWELVHLLDPKYKRVEYLITKAKTMLKKLEEIKRGKK